MHVHTEYSSDCNIKLDQIIPICRAKGLNGVAITDHNTIEGALRLKEKAPHDFVVIIGEEIKTKEGEITGFFLRKKVPSFLSPDETIEKIKDQGGLVSIPHPFCSFRKSRLLIDQLRNQIDRIEIIETFNSRNIFHKYNRMAYDYALEHKKAMVVGSDAHLSYEYGRSYICIPPFDDKKQFILNLHASRLITKMSPFWVHIPTKFNKILRWKSNV